MSNTKLHFDTLQLHAGQQIDPTYLKNVLTPHRSENGLPMTVRYSGSGVACEIMLGDAWRVAPNDELQGSLAEKLGKESVVVEY